MKTEEIREIWYRTPEFCEESFYVLKTKDYIGDMTTVFWQERVAQKCADDFHSNHEGYEEDWPVIFALHESENGPEIARFEVYREFQPVFSAIRIDAVTGQEQKGE